MDKVLAFVLLNFVVILVSIIAHETVHYYIFKYKGYEVRFCKYFICVEAEVYKFDRDVMFLNLLNEFVFVWFIAWWETYILSKIISL